MVVFGIRLHYHFSLQRSFSLGQRYFREELQGWFQYTIWRGGFLVKGSSFHLQDLLEEATLFFISDQPHVSSLYVAINLQPQGFDSHLVQWCISENPFWGSSLEVVQSLDLYLLYLLRHISSHDLCMFIFCSSAPYDHVVVVFLHF